MKAYTDYPEPEEELNEVAYQENYPDDDDLELDDDDADIDIDNNDSDEIPDGDDVDLNRAE